MKSLIHPSASKKHHQKWVVYRHLLETKEANAVEKDHDESNMLDHRKIQCHFEMIARPRLSSGIRVAFHHAAPTSTLQKC
ncbi:hypothetical protein GJ744_009563 [Endocarpon pusillum]|uniref:Uncharacterized protein n=1 Tax=Endocarpon pusillum TaxID=364733 RepID=A0A8H7E3M0_9EURO|nr:hypothetical protein GJ744_009563 [Endocarpon pusillum]